VFVLILHPDLIILLFRRRAMIKSFYPNILSIYLCAFGTGSFSWGAGALPVLGPRNLGPAGERAQVARPSQFGLAIFNTA